MKLPGLGLVAHALSVRAEDDSQSTRHVFAEYLQGAMTRAGISMTAERALEVSWVWSSVVLLAETAGTLPLVLYRRTKDGGKERATNHPLYRVLRTRPNVRHTAPEFWSLVNADVEMHGNALAQRVGVGGALELWPIPWKTITPKDLGAGQALYDVRESNGQTRHLRETDVLHFRGPLGTSLCAESVVDRHRDLFALAWAIDAYVQFSFKNGARFAGAFSKKEGKLSDKAYLNLKAWIANEYLGLANSGKPILLEEGLDFQTISQTHREAEVIQLLDKVGAAIARVFGVPLHMLAANIAQPRANMEQQGAEFVTLSLRRRCSRIAERVNCDLLDDGEEYFAEHLYDDLLRGDTTSRYQAYQTAVGRPWMTPDEARARENLNLMGGEMGEVSKPLNMGGGPSDSKGGAKPAAPGDASPKDDGDDDEEDDEEDDD